MLEPVRCPSCSTRYGLTAERVGPGIRRARCIRCGEDFPIGEVVARLLAASRPEAEAALPAPAPEALPEVPEAPELMDLTGLDDLAPLAPEAAPAEAESLTLGDLEGDAEDLLEKTLVVEPQAQATPEEAAEADLDFEPSGTYSSAKDAISKLLGEAPAAPGPSRAIASPRSQSMDVEATLDALEDTLSGTHPQTPRPAPTPMTASGTIRLGAQDIQAALGATRPQPVTPAVPTPTVALPRPTHAVAPETPQDQNLLKVQVGGETYSKVTLDQMSAWIEQGRVLEHHMVARQFSDNWIEASKVPQLRPVFERARQRRQAQAALPTPPPMEAVAPKRGLFGGFFKS